MLTTKRKVQLKLVGLCTTQEPWNFVWWCGRLNITTTPEQVFAARILEAKGKRFLVDFGTDNCVELAAGDNGIEEWFIGH